MNWKILSSEYLYKETWFTIRKDTCETAEGKIISPYYVYEFPTWVTAVAITEDRQVVMVRQYRHAIQQTILEIPGGCVDATDASFREAIARELLEETGYEFKQYDYLGKISPNPSTNNNFMHMYLATGGVKIQNQNLDFNEEIEVELYTLDQLKEMVRNNEILQALHVTAILYAFVKLGEINL